MPCTGAIPHASDEVELGQFPSLTRACMRQSALVNWQQATLAPPCPGPPCPFLLLPAPAGAFNFSIKRGGLLYGTVEEDNTVKVEFIYEPPQVGTEGPGGGRRCGGAGMGCQAR